jgi:hypothetical protein
VARIFVISGGASFSVADVDRGVIAGLRAAGHDVGVYAYDARLGAWHHVLDWLWRRTKRQHPETAKPTFAELQLNALSEAQLIAQLNEADWVLFVSGMFVPLPLLKAWRRYCRIPIALLLTESPYDLENERRWAEQAHMVWTNERSAVEALRSVNPQTRYLPHAWLPGVHDVVPVDLDQVPAHDVVFVGTGFTERIEFLEAIDWTGINLGLYGNWKKLSRRSPLKAYVQGGIQANAVTSALYRRAQVGLNLYRQSKGWSGQDRIAYAESLNPRAYELAASGCFQISDPRAEISEMFGDAVPIVSTPQTCEAMIRRALADAPWRDRCSRLACARVQGHTWLTRGAQIAADLEQMPHLHEVAA